MKPTKILAENFKSFDFSHDLDRVTMFTGPNESGKTARLEAIKVALLGYDPRVGKQPSATIGFASESRVEMTVHMEFDNDLSITRTFKRKTDGDVSRTSKGEIPAIPPILFDASEYLNDTSAGRIKTVFDRIDISKIVVSDVDLLSKLGKIEVIPAFECGPAVMDLNVLVNKTIKRRTDLKQTPQVWLEELVKTLADQQKGEKASMDQASAQMQSLRPKGNAPASVIQELKAAREKLGELEGQKSAINSAIDAHQRTSARRSAIQAALSKPDTDTSALEKERDELNKAVAAYESNTPSLKAVVQEWDRKEVTVAQQIVDSKAEIASLENRLRDLEGKVKCPFCKSNRQGWKEETMTEVQNQISSAKAILGLLTADQKNSLDSLAKARADLAASEKADARHRESANRLTGLNNDIALAAKAKNERAKLQGELDGLNQVEIPDEAKRLEIINAITNQNAVIMELAGKEAEATAWAKNKEAYSEAEKKLIKHQVRVEVYKQAGKMVVEEQRAIVSKAFDSILAPARRFTDGIIGGKLDYQNDELGIQTDSGWVGHKFMSRSQTLLAYTGLQVALAQQSPVKCVLIDECGQFDRTRKQQVINRMLELTQEGFIDAFVGTEPEKSDYVQIALAETPGFKLFELSIAI